MAKRILVEMLMEDDEFEEFGPRLLELDNEHRPDERKRDLHNFVHQAAAIVQAFCYDDGAMGGEFIVKSVETVSTCEPEAGTEVLYFSAEEMRVLRDVNDSHLSMLMGSGELSDADDDVLSAIVDKIGYPTEDT